jgi:NTP pyrophosphatase (non-canonical NTP hydrolase)
VTRDRRLSTRDYEASVRLTDKGADAKSSAFPLLGLFGETGSLLSEVKKKQRDPLSYVGYAAAVVEELGDVLWYLTIYADRIGLSLTEIADMHVNGETSGRRPAQPVVLASLQHPKFAILDAPTPAFERTLLDLAAAVGSAVAAGPGASIGVERAARAAGLVQVLGLLVRAADEAGVTLDEAAARNIEKILDRWPIDRVYPPLFDEGEDETESLPRSLTIEIFERTVGGRTYVFQRCHGIHIGDRLTDNSPTTDDYRFHDVFHYAYAAVLGWSPVTRSLFRVKRKSRPDVDESEDGARAALSEEGIAAWIFGESEPLRYFEGLRSGDLPFGLLKQVRDFVRRYEVGRCPLWLWEDAILQGFAAFRSLRDHRRARLVISLERRSLTVEPLNP